MPQSRDRRLVVLVLGLALIAAACSSGSDREARTARRGSTSTSSTSTSAPAAPTIAWTECDGGQCGTLAVPLDRADPGGEQIELALFRQPAADPQARLGSLLVNPGGPGAPGTDFARSIAQYLPDELVERFDIVGWDPRGTGASTAVDCGDDLDYLFAPDTAPDDPAELGALADAGARFAAACQRGSPALLDHVMTRDTVDDMESIRAALGDPGLSYLGFSYGTLLGARYAEAYPQQVRALVLDGAVDPSISVEELSIQQASGFQQAFDAFLASCSSDPDCAINRGGGPRAVYDAVAARAETDPIRVTIDGEERVLGPSLVDLAVAGALYGGAAAYTQIARALDDAARGDAQRLVTIADRYVGREPGGTYDGSWAAFLAINCGDGPPLDRAGTEELQRDAASAAPDFGAANVGLTGYVCAAWPVEAASATAAPVRAPDAPPIVVIGTTGDPATPVAWATGLADQLASARLVLLDGTAHTAFLEGSDCVDGIVVRYLVSLDAPADDTRC